MFLDYRTAFVDEAGRLNLRADLYGYDRDGITLFEGKGLPLEPYLGRGHDCSLSLATPGGPILPVGASRPAS